MRGVEELEKIYEDYMYMAAGLRYDHQQTTRNILIRKANDVKEEIRETEQLLCAQYKQRKLEF